MEAILKFIGMVIGYSIMAALALTVIAPVVALVMLIGKKIWRFVHGNR